MTSLAEAYDRRAGEVGRERLYLGTGLFLAGALMVVAAILAGATTLPMDAGLIESVYGARELAGALAGLGVPAVFLGIFVVLPASGATRAAAAIGAAVAVLGVVLFTEAYPYEWYATAGVPSSQTLLVATVYFFGVLTTFWCLFAAVATFKRRNDPGGMVTLTYTEGGVTRTVRVMADDAAEAKAALGGVGVFGGVDDPDRETATSPGDLGNATAPTGGAVSDGGAAAAGGSDAGGAETVEGGEDHVSAQTPDDDGHVLGAETDDTDLVDRYCGNCTHFDYVRSDEGIKRYCGFHEEVMDDMDACRQWESNSD
ncbi:MAG: hypothetical protein ABEJ42_07520 [Halobacteriaceae archaeon]